MSAAARPGDALLLKPTSLASGSHRSRPWWALVTGGPHRISGHTRGATAPSAGRHMLRPRDATDFTADARSQHGYTRRRHRAEDSGGHWWAVCYREPETSGSCPFRCLHGAEPASARTEIRRAPLWAMLWARLPYLADASRAATEGEGFALVAVRGQDHVCALAHLLAQGLSGWPAFSFSRQPSRACP